MFWLWHSSGCRKKLFPKQSHWSQQQRSPCREGEHNQLWEAVGKLRAPPRPAQLERSLGLAPGTLLPEDKAVMESFSVNQKPSVSVRDGVGNEHYALGKAKGDSINVCFFDCSSVRHNQVLLKSVNKHFLFPYPSYSSDVRKGFTGNLEEKKQL